MADLRAAHLDIYIYFIVVAYPLRVRRLFLFYMWTFYKVAHIFVLLYSYIQHSLIYCLVQHAPFSLRHCLLLHMADMLAVSL